MRKEKIVQIEVEKGLKKDITVYEIRVFDLIKTMESEDARKDKSYDNLFGLLLPLCCSLEKDEFEQLYPTDMKILWDTFKEVNGFFFEGAGLLEKMPVLNHWINEFLNAIQVDIVRRLGVHLLDFLGVDITTPETTDGNSSLTQSEK